MSFSKRKKGKMNCEGAGGRVGEKNNCVACLK